MCSPGPRPQCDAPAQPVHTRRLELFIDDRAPAYGILSHTWGADEILADDLDGPADKASKAPAWWKLIGYCAEVNKFGLDYVWVDRCCI